jgi:5-methylcytosine-specific restriction endonuclease McrA
VICTALSAVNRLPNVTVITVNEADILGHPPIKWTENRFTAASCAWKKKHEHHIIYRSNGGKDTPDNVVMVCRKCHVKLHSENGDYANWGRLGGKTTANRHHYINNLKQFKNPKTRTAYLARLEAAECIRA